MEERQIRPTVVKQALWLGLVVAFAVLALSACGGGGGGGGGGGQAQKQETKAPAIPKVGKALPAGKYVTEGSNLPYRSPPVRAGRS